MISFFKKYSVELFLSLALIYFSFLLFSHLWAQSFWIDEGYSSYVAKYMSLEWFYKSSYFLFEWLQAICFKLWDINDFRARFPSVIAHLISILLMYLITVKFSKNKYFWLFSALIFWLLYREQWWARDARFYSLVQMMFLLWIYTILKWTEKNSVVYLNLSLIIAGLGAIFHPFLYCLGAILIAAFFSQYKKCRDWKSIFSKKYLSTLFIVLVWLIIVIYYWTLWNVLNWTLTNGLSWAAKKYYFIFYSSHLWGELWLISVSWVMWMLFFIIKKKLNEIIFLVLPFLMFVYALVIKWYLMHSRYALLMIPILILSTALLFYYLSKYLKTKYALIISSIIVLISIFLTAKLQFTPLENYYFDYTSPQPNFKSAYEIIPDWSNVISWFPTLCDWYYSSRGNCSNALRVDLVHDWKNKLKDKKAEKYTKIEYLNDVSELKKWIYYLVVDDLTSNSDNLNKKLYDQFSKKWEVIFWTWKSYNSIFVMKILIN